MKNFLFILSLFVFMFPAIAFSTPYSIDTALNTSVDSAGMDGMEVTITWQGGDTETFIWSSGISGTGDSGEDWSLDFYGLNTSTLALDWRLETDDAIDSFTINTIPGNVFFDIIYDDTAPGETPNSQNGFWGPNFEDSNTAFATSGTYGPDILYGGAYSSDSVNKPSTYGAEFDWEFSNPGYLSTNSSFPDPATSPHDLVSALLIDLTDTSGFEGTFNFGVDTDNVTGANPVPEPATMLLFGLGLLGLGALGRKKT
ncbi:MAG: PEP-CTERM sorting domain-containing protein [Desulfobacula sp.]|nr:PEP-CTERM sorting domain-containing protein [Desulfobacula sp.]